MNILDKNTYDLDYVVAPGQLIREYIDDSQITLIDFANRLNLTRESLTRILNGEQTVSFNTAEKLELVTGIKSYIWLKIEKEYRNNKDKIFESREGKNWLNKIRLNELINRKFVEKKTNTFEQLKEVYKFFQVGNLSAWEKIWNNPYIVARSSANFEPSHYVMASWVQMGLNKAKNIKCKKYDRRNFVIALAEIKKLTKQSPAEFMPKIKQLCAEAGIAFVFVPQMKGAHFNGVAKWINKDKAIIILSDMGKYEDIFWFSFFHEASHILNDGKKILFVSSEESAKDPIEIKANDFAAKFLIPKEFDSKISDIKSGKDIIQLAELLDISPGIVAGRYEFDTKNYRLFKNLRKKLDIQQYSKFS